MNECREGTKEILNNYMTCYHCQCVCSNYDNMKEISIIEDNHPFLLNGVELTKSNKRSGITDTRVLKYFRLIENVNGFEMDKRPNFYKWVI